MLSLGETWKELNKDKTANLEFRCRVLEAAANDPFLQSLLWDLCKNDIIFWLNVFVATYDPRTVAGRIIGAVPFNTYPYQDEGLPEILRAIVDGRDLVIEKSRDMGASWMCIVIMTWLFLFHRNTSFLMVSRKEDLVDAPGDPDSLFWKVDFILRHLPRWMLPKTPIDRRKLHFGNLDNGSTIDGESTTAAAGVGGRRTAMFIDEFSRIEEGYQLLAGTADTTNCRIFNFTPWGTSNAAYDVATRENVRKLRLHWSRHPEKAKGLYKYNEHTRQVEIIDKIFAFPVDFQFVMDGRLRSPWYDGECIRRANEREIAQMLDIDYQGSAYQFFDKSTILELQRAFAMEPFWEGDLVYNKHTGRPERLVQVKGGLLKLWLNPDVNGKPKVSKYGIGADLSTGSGATNSCLSIGDGATGEKVGQFASPFLRQHEMAAIAVGLAWLFVDEDNQPAILGWEQQGPGITFGKSVLELGFTRVFMKENTTGKFSGKMSHLPGWHSSPDTKRDLLTEYRRGLASRECINRCSAALAECLFFIHTATGTVEHSKSLNVNDPTGARVNHGDQAMADALMWKIVKPLKLKTVIIASGEPPVNSLAWRRQQRELARRERELV